MAGVGNKGLAEKKMTMMMMMIEGKQNRYLHYILPYLLRYLQYYLTYPTFATLDSLKRGSSIINQEMCSAERTLYV